MFSVENLISASRKPGSGIPSSRLRLNAGPIRRNQSSAILLFPDDVTRKLSSSVASGSCSANCSRGPKFRSAAGGHDGMIRGEPSLIPGVASLLFELISETGYQRSFPSLIVVLDGQGGVTAGTRRWILDAQG